MSKLELTLYSPHPKQLETHQSPARFKVLNWGRRCLAENSMVLMSSGEYKPIQDISSGDEVYSFNHAYQTLEPKKVTDTIEYGIDSEPKPMLYFKIYDKTFRVTYDHPFYHCGRYTPIYELAWGGMETIEQNKLLALCEQYGQSLTFEVWDKKVPQAKNTSGVTSQGVQPLTDRREEVQSASLSGGKLSTEGASSDGSEPHRRRQAKQSRQQSGVGYSQREYDSRVKKRPIPRQDGRESQYEQNDSRTGYQDSPTTQGERTFLRSYGETTSKRLSEYELAELERHITGQKLETSSVTAHPTETTYDITVEDNHNFICQGLLVHNTGKSLFAMNHTLIEATKRVGRYWIVAPTYRQAKNIYWLDVLPNTIPKELIAKKNESELIIHLINGSLIELKGADNPDSLRGAGIKGLILDEYAFMSPSVWETILRPTLVDSGGWAIFISTPNGFNHFYDLAEYAQGHDSYFYSHATSYDNPHIPDQEIDDLRDDYIAKGKENEFYQEYMGEFRKMSGLVYKTFDRKIHVVDPKDIPETGTHLLSVDFGYTNPMAAVFVLVDRDDNWWVYDELYDTGLVTEQAVNIIQTKMGNNRFSTMVGDSAAAQEIANFNNAGLPIKPCEKTKDSIMSGIRTISDRLKVQEGTGKPKLFISSVCTNLIFEFEAYHYPEEKEGRNASEMPLKENDHALDALRYLAISVHNTNRATIYKPSFYKKSAKSRVIRPRR